MTQNFSKNQIDDYRHMLRSVLVERAARNSQYSPRALARDMGVKPSRLSEILHGKDGLSPKSAKDVAERLAFSNEERERFVTMVEAQAARCRVVRDAAKERLAHLEPSKERRLLREDCISSLANPSHFARLEFLRSGASSQKKAYLAERLGMSVESISDSLARLERLGLIKKIGRLYQFWPSFR